MTNLKQFLVDPIMNDKEKILVNALWLQKQLRDFEKLVIDYNKLHGKLVACKAKQDSLRHDNAYLELLAMINEPKYRELDIKGNYEKA